jgi:hypothetical protein
MAETRSALIIACEAFADPGLPRLQDLVSAASTFGNVLEDPYVGDFEVRMLADQPARVIRSGVAEFFAGSRPGDLLLVYYGGYGIRDADGELYLAAADTATDRLETTAVRAGFVNRQIGIGGSRNVVLLLDCPDPGVFSRGARATGAGRGIEREFRGRGRAVIAASGPPGYGSWQPTFTEALGMGLATRAADRDEDGRVGLDDLYDYVVRKTRHTASGPVSGLTGLDETPYLTRDTRLDSYGQLGRSRGLRPAPPPDGTPRLIPMPRDVESPLESTEGTRRGIGPLDVPSFSRIGRTPAALFWNTRFPRDQGILLNRPHLVVAGAEYRLETGLGRKAEPGAVSSPQEPGRLLGRQIRYRLEAENGEFRLPDSAQWQVMTESPAMTCTIAGTDAFAVFYRSPQAGTAIIRALLIVDNGSVDQQQIKLTAVADDDEAETVPRSSGADSPARPVGRSVAGAPSPDYRLSIWKYFADLSHHNTRVGEVKLQPELAEQLKEVATAQYSELRDVSLQHPLQAGGGLRVADSGEAKLRLAKAGAELHRRLFREPVREITGGLPAKLGAMADYLRDTGDAADPPLLQIITHDFPLPWGLLYDRSSDGGEDLKAPEDVDEAGFWGRRFDIYRSVVSVDRDTRRGRRRWVKPVIGFDVPRNQEQQDYVDGLRADLSDVLLRVEDTVSTVPDLRDWATGGGDSDLIYLFCHTRPARYGKPGNWLGLGQAEDEERVGLDELEQWWGKPRLTNPIVILNACSSGQQDTIYGAPFVEFFMDKWGAQAFIGTDWPINASFADVFGRRLLREILVNRHSLRDAFRVVSDEAAAADNFFPLMYAIYGLNTVQFTDPLSA